MDKLKHCIMLNGLNQRFHSGALSFSDVFRTAKHLGGHYFEFVPSQMEPDYPNPKEAWINEFKTLCSDYEMIPYAYSITTDPRGGPVNTPEGRFSQIITDMRIAAKLGFSVLRIQSSISPEGFEALLPYCETYGIHVAPEMHTPFRPTDPYWQALLNIIERKNTTLLGIVPDYSSFAEAPPACFLNTVNDNSCSKALLIELRDLYEYSDLSEDELREYALAHGSESDLALLESLILSPELPADLRYDRHKVDYDGLKTVLAHSAYIHGKFYYIDDLLNCKGINYKKIVQIMKAVNFNGVNAAEFEGFFYDASLMCQHDVQVERYIRMMDLLWETE